VNDWLRLARDAITRNFGLKVASVAIAVAVHFIVQRDSVREATLEVPLVITNLAPGKVLVGDVPQRVRVRVRGRWGEIRELLADRGLKLVADLGPYRSGERHVFEARSIEQQMPGALVEVVGTEPAAIDVQLETVESKTVPVEVEWVGTPAPGFRVAAHGVLVEPARVRVTGPTSGVRRISWLRATPVDVSGAVQDLKVSARLVPPAENHVRVEADTVAVTVKLDELDIARTLPSQPVVVRGCSAASRCLLDPTSVAVRIDGLARAVNALVAAPPDELVVADVVGPIARGERSVRLQAAAVKGLAVTLQPAVAKFSVLSEIPPAPPPR
jgi:hypothetical protein